MRKFAAVACIALGMLTVPGVARATPFGTNACALDANDISVCDIFADYDDGLSALGAADGNLGGYLLGYTFLLNSGANLSTFEASDVAHILVIHDQVFELFSNTASSLLFSGIFTAASTGANIDGLSPDLGQLAGCPAIPSGVPLIDGVGYCTNADLVTLGVNWGVVGAGGLDILNIHTARPNDTLPPTPVPEPGTLSLLALGSAGAFVAARRKRAGKSS